MNGLSHDRTTFTNWAGNQLASPLRATQPTTETELANLVEGAAAVGHSVKAVGSGHSFTAIAMTSGVLIDLSAYNRVLEISGNRVTVQAGITLHSLAQQLAEAGLALPNLGDIDVQTVAGATSTGTHGTGLGFHGIASAITAIRAISGEGEVVEFDAEQLRVGRVGLGAAGLLSTITLECVPAFWMHAVEEPLALDAVLEGFDEWSEVTDHAEFFWMPHTDKALVKRNTRRATGPAQASKLKRVSERLATELTENVGFGAMCRVGKARPDLIPKMAAGLAKGFGRKEYTAPSWEVFATPRRVKFIEMEYAVPREAWKSAFAEVRALIDIVSDDEPINFPIEVRVLGGDDIPMSMASGRDSVFIAVHNFRGMAYERYFHGVESIMKRHGGRPHWGKMHYRKAADLAEVYPQWDAFGELVAQLDPNGTFRNPYLNRILG